MRERKALLFVAFVGLAATAHGSPRDYVGADACAEACHPQVLAAWRKTAHARAASPQVLGARLRDAGCLTCHATGDGLAPRRKLPGVQCEACHGGGARYAEEDLMRDPWLARKLGLADAKASCARCHRPDTATTPVPFDYALAWPKIAH